MIEFQGISKRFAGRHRAAGVQALRDVSLRIETGAAVGVVGPNGAGKSTLFSLLLGFLRPSTGQLLIDGELPRAYTRKRGVGYLPERFSLPPDWAVRSALHAFAELDRVADHHTRADQLLERLGLEPHADKAIHALSRGLLQRLGIAQAVLARRELIVLDEPTEGLDPVWRVRFRELIAELKASERTLLIASHDLNEIERLVDRVILLDAGAVRESFAIAREDSARRRYRIELESAIPGAAQLFGITLDQAIPDPRSPETTEAPVSVASGILDARILLVEVANTRELSTRLAALLELGAIIQSVEPADALEDRVRAALQPGKRA